MAVSTDTKPETWTIGELKEHIVAKRVRIPRFQRSLVWTEEQRQSLIDSLFRGYPIGSLLVHERLEDDSLVFLLVDGLQRATCILDYSEAPLSYVQVDELDIEIALKLMSAMENLVDDPALDGEHRGDVVASVLQHWLHQTKSPRAAQGFTSVRLLESLEEQCKLTSDQSTRKAFEETANQFIDQLPAEISIDKVRVPMLIYRGPAGELPEIFQRVNSLGTPLNKYQIFAASWSDQAVKIMNKAISANIEQKFEQLLQEGYQVEGVDEPPTLFDYLAGLGGLLTESFPLLFRRPSNPVEIEGIGFSLATVAHGLRMSEMGSLPEAMASGGGQIDVDGFEKALLASIAFVNEVLEPYIGIRLNQAGVSFAHGEYQIASMITRCLIGRFDPGSWIERHGWEEEAKTLRQTLPQFYLYDLLQGNWRGAGDSRMFDWTWTLSSDKKATSATDPSSLYLVEPSAEAWNRTLDTWFSDSQLAKLSKGRAALRQLEKAFLRFVYADVLKHLEHQQKTFELDHIFPVGRLAPLAQSSTSGWPINCIANLALFEDKLNRMKGKLSVPEYLIQKDVKAAEKEMVKRYLLCNPNETAIPHTQDGTDALDLPTFEAFLAKRFGTMKERVLHALGR